MLGLCCSLCEGFSLLEATGELSCSMAYGILVPQPGFKLTFLALQGRFLTSGPPGKSPESYLWEERNWDGERKGRETKGKMGWDLSDWLGHFERETWDLGSCSDVRKVWRCFSGILLGKLGGIFPAVLLRDFFKEVIMLPAYQWSFGC